jgi:hypothetical protein
MYTYRTGQSMVTPHNLHEDHSRLSVLHFLFSYFHISRNLQDQIPREPPESYNETSTTDTNRQPTGKASATRRTFQRRPQHPLATLSDHHMVDNLQDVQRENQER